MPDLEVNRQWRKAFWKTQIFCLVVQPVASALALKERNTK
jgi:hypothetical protein